MKKSKIYFIKEKKLIKRKLTQSTKEEQDLDSQLEKLKVPPVHIIPLDGELEDFYPIKLFEKDIKLQKYKTNYHNRKKGDNLLVCWSKDDKCKFVSENRAQFAVKFKNKEEFGTFSFQPSIRLISHSNALSSRLANITFYGLHQQNYTVGLKLISVRASLCFDWVNRIAPLSICFIITYIIGYIIWIISNTDQDEANEQKVGRVFRSKFSFLMRKKKNEKKDEYEAELLD